MSFLAIASIMIGLFVSWCISILIFYFYLQHIRQRAEKDLANMAKFPNENPFPVMRIAGDGTILFANASSLSLLEEWSTEIGHAVPSVWKQVVSKVLESGQVEEDIEVDHQDRVLSFAAAPVVEAGYVNFYGLDVTERNRAEDELRRARGELELRVQQRTAELKASNEALAAQTQKLARSNAELEQFAYIVSHDLQEPLRMISSYVTLLARRYQGRLDDDADDFIGFAVDGATRMRALINDLLAYSRLTTEARSFEPVDCQDVLEAVMLNLKMMIEETGAEVVPQSLPTVNGDELQLLQLWQNLIGNAIKFHQDGVPPKVVIGAEKRNGAWVFSVKDNGIGMDPQNADRIFRVFQRLHTREEFPGTGIGLAVCKKIVERHGGRIWVESQPGTGSTFYFSIPKQTSDRACEAGTPVAG